MTEHTKLPWELGKLGFATNDGAIPIMAEMPDGDRKRICLVDCHAEFKRGKGYKATCEERDANAAFILRAANVHDELVDALQTMLDAIDGRHLTEGDCNQARAALAKAQA